MQCDKDVHCNDGQCNKDTTYNNRPQREKICFNCLTTETPLWRRSKKGVNLCNACGLYFRNHGEHRPMNKCGYQNQPGSYQFDKKMGQMERVAISALAELKMKVKSEEEHRREYCAVKYFIPMHSTRIRNNALISEILKNQQTIQNRSVPETKDDTQTGVSEAIEKLASFSNYK